MSCTGTHPTIAYWHLWTDDDGVSHQQRCELTAFELKGVGAADPQWNDQQPRGEATTVFTVQPVGWVGDGHENPAPQWIVPLSGRWRAEAMDGTRVEMGSGRVGVRRGPGLHAGCLGTARAPVRDPRPAASGADDRAIACETGPPALPPRLMPIQAACP